ncbi:MAG: type 1 glutamine amidotransferase domain-containing protein [Bacteroidota bacterium]
MNAMINPVEERVGFAGGYDASADRGKVLMVAANPSVSEQTGWPIGAWAAELTHPYLEFARAGYAVDIVSPLGGKVEFDGYSDPRDPSGYSAGDVISLGFVHSPGLMQQLESTAAIAEVNGDDYAAIFLVGGQSPMYTFRNNAALKQLFARFYEAGKPSAAVCHATCILLDTQLSDGSLLVKNKAWTGFADSEEQFADQAVGQRIQPFWIETEARKIAGTNFKVKPAFTPYAIRDGHLVTGQQQNSGAEAAQLVIELLAQ